mgnify:FL=1
MNNPKVSYMMQFVVSGATTYLGSEDKDFWSKSKMGVEASEVVKPCEAIILGEVLQKAEDPIAMLREASEKAKRVLIIVPNEYSWDAKYKPLTNKEHRRVYDTELLAQHLEEVGLDYVIGLVEYGGWSFLTGVAGRSQET